jgi:hypothetical protein
VREGPRVGVNMSILRVFNVINHKLNRAIKELPTIDKFQAFVKKM